MQAGTCLLPHLNSNVAVMWHIPPPNSSLSFKVSAIFPLGEIGDVFVYVSTMSRNFNILLFMP